MTNATDLRRAKAIVRVHANRTCKGISEDAAWPQASINMRADAKVLAAAIRASDEAAGMVLVPMQPTQQMYDAAGAIIEREYGESDWETAKDMAESLSPTPIYNAILAAHGGEDV
jgi:hypothetical protein